jgi:hypothetical protein
MKKKILFVFISLSLISCSDDFIRRSSLTDIAENNFWQSEADAYLALNGAYSVLQHKSMYGGHINGWQGIPGFDCLGDNAFNTYKWEGPGIFMEGTLDPTNGPVLAFWTDHYIGIARVNSVIKNLKDISESLVPANTKKQLLGQAYFLRALFYFNLAIYFEDVPLITEPQTIANAYNPKNTYAEITAQITEDLKYASENLPVKHATDKYGYATKGAALGLFARVQMYNKVYTGDFGVLKLTEQALSLGYSLNPSYAGLFSEAGENSNEIVFAVRFQRADGGNSGETFSATYPGTPKVDQKPMHNLVFDYYCKDGKPIASSPLYNAAQQQLNRDPRCNATIYFKGDVFYTNPTTTYNGLGPTPYGMKKYIRTGPDALGNASFGEGSQDFYVIRYADILLMRAEAMVETNDIEGAKAMVNKVRDRVTMPRVENAEGIVNQEQMRTIVRHERRVELALEGLRFMDLKRWNTLEEGFFRASIDPVGPYNPQYLGGRSKVFPIPASEIDVNKKLVQHPSWL